MCLLVSCLQNNTVKTPTPEDRYAVKFENKHATINTIVGIISATISTAWLVLGFIPYAMAISDSPYVTGLGKAVTTTIYLGVPVCGYILSARLLEW
jgi:hypothetical protein